MGNNFDFYKKHQYGVEIWDEMKCHFEYTVIFVTPMSQLFRLNGW